MTSPIPDHKPLKTLIVEVRLQDDGCITFRRPPDRYRDDYRVVYDPQNQEPRIEIFCGVCPVHLQFNGNFPLTAVGFAELSGDPPAKHSTPGPCGGCFHLVSGFDGTFNTPPILNEGKPPNTYYRFTLWGTDDGGNEVALTAGIDPQIYNQGDGPDDEL